MKKVLILYFSGAGATGRIAALIHAGLRAQCHATLSSIEAVSPQSIGDFDAYVLGTPVYHGAPAILMMDFIGAIPPRKNPAPAFLYNTRATWSCNTNRILAKALAEKNIVTVMDRDYRSPASDGSLIVSFLSRFHAFDPNIAAKVQRDCAEFVATIIACQEPRGYIPRFRLSGVLNAPNKLAGQLVTFTIHLHRDSCRRCGACIQRCPHGAYSKDPEGYPRFVRQKCENCYRCIHHCPAKALSLSRRRRVKKQLYKD